jgi:hypothetical protein
MKCMRIALVSLLLHCSMIGASAESSVPVKAQTTAEILAVVDSLYPKCYVNTVEVSHYDAEVFVMWYCPYWGRSNNRVHAYSFDAKENRWVRFLDREFASEVTVVVGYDLTIRDDAGTVFRRPW